MTDQKPPDGTAELTSMGGGDRLIGQLIDGRFKLRLVLGEGGMGKVYLAEDQKLNGRRVALKLMSPRLTMDDEFRTRFEREAVLQANLPHPQIIQIQDMGECPEGAFIVMEYSEGRSLSRLIKELGPRPLDRALDLLEQILEVLDFAHGQSIIHRDLKPSNILIEERPGREVVRLLDFGIAKLLGDGSSPGEALTRTGFAYGTMGYMAPEQARGDSEQLDHRADLYSVGIMFYEMLTGEVPAPPESRTHPVRYAMWLQENSIPLISETHPELAMADHVDRIIRKALRRDPAKRYPSALAFLGDVREFRREATASTVASRVSTPRTTAERSQKTVAESLGGRRGGIWGWVVAFVCLVAAGYAFMLYGDARDQVAKLERRPQGDASRIAQLEADRKSAGERADALSDERDNLLIQKGSWNEERTGLDAARTKAVGDLAKATTEISGLRQEKRNAEQAKEEAVGAKDKAERKNRELEKEVEVKAGEIKVLQKSLSDGGGDEQLKALNEKLEQQLKTERARLGELVLRPTQESYDALVRDKRRVEGERDRAEGALEEANVKRGQAEAQREQAQRTEQASIRQRDAERSDRKLRDSWIRRLIDRVGRAAVPLDLWPPPGIRDTPAPPPDGTKPRVVLVNDTSTQVEIKIVEVRSPSGVKRLNKMAETVAAGKSISFDLPPGATRVDLRWDAGWDKNRRGYLRRGNERSVAPKGPETRVSLGK
ncbi:MAG: hypothetical protein CL908_23140 [Deltaproteobacteria bacterium]|nr:hypothetical protein [Deltaproteobacteria bacterium]